MSDRDRMERDIFQAWETQYAYNVAIARARAAGFHAGALVDWTGFASLHGTYPDGSSKFGLAAFSHDKRLNDNLPTRKG
jgi:hypothetical protein